MDVTYHTYQHILDLNSANGAQSLKQKRIRRKFKKSLDGCIACKQKRKKCDEKKPSCSSCVRRGVRCVWPKHVTERLQDLHVRPIKQSGLETNELSNDDDNEEPLLSANEMFDLNFTDDPLLYEFLHIQSILNEEEKGIISRRSSSSVGTSARLEQFEHSIPGVNLTNEEARCYDAFVTHFLTTITPAHCDPLLSPMTLLLPYAVDNATVREIFLACGATLLAYSDDEFVSKSHQRYVKSVGLLVQDIQNSSDGCEDELFIAVQLLQTLCLRDKSLGLNATKGAGHLAAAYEILKKRFLKCATTENMSLRLSPLDRTLTEHFIFNFPVTLILCRHDKLSKVPSPFKFFEQFGGMLSRPFYTSQSDASENDWTIHPILGVGLKAHEICTKSTWLMRTKALPLHPEDILRVLELREQLTAELERLSGLMSDKLTNDQRQSIAYARAKLYSCAIILIKLRNPDITITDLEIQENLSNAIEDMKYSRQLDKDHLLSIWAMFITGSAAIQQDHRYFIEEGFGTVSRKIRSSLAQKVLRYLNIVWDEQEQVGLEFLFDTTVLDIVCT